MKNLSRRDLLRTAAVGLGGLSVSGWLPALAQELAADQPIDAGSSSAKRKRHCILLWMSGGPSQTDTFDMKPGHENGGEFKEVATKVPGIRFSEHLPILGTMSDRMAIVRSLSTKEGDHSRGTYLMRTGEKPMGPIGYPSISCSIAHNLGDDSHPLPRCVSIAPYQAFNREAFGPGFLGPKETPLIVSSGAGGTLPGIVPAAAMPTGGFADLRIDSLNAPVGLTPEQAERRKEFWQKLQTGFVARHQGAAAAHHEVYQKSMNLMNKETAEAFDMAQEPRALRQAYGPGVFGQGCLMARRLIERGVPVVEVTLNHSTTGGHTWDSHSQNFVALKELSAELDAGWGTLMKDLDQRGLLDVTTILWMGEFGRTPRINSSAGRDHFPAAWSCVLAGGGIAGGQAYGKTTPDGARVEENPVGAKDVLATLAQATGVDPFTENHSPDGRPIKVVDGYPIQDLLA